MRTILILLLTSTTLLGQAASTSTVTAATPHVSLRGLANPEVVSPGSQVTLTFDLTPARRMHVYAPGADYQVVAVKLDSQPGVKARDVVYPPSEIYIFEPTSEQVPVYQKAFTLKQVVDVSGAALKGKSSLTLSGRLEYQACDDKVCFKPNSIPFKFDLTVKR